MKKEQTRLINRIKGLLASQGVDGVMGRSGLVKPLEAVKTWDGSSLPEGLRQRLELEIERHAFVHRQVLSCDAQVLSDRTSRKAANANPANASKEEKQRLIVRRKA